MDAPSSDRNMEPVLLKPENEAKREKREKSKKNVIEPTQNPPARGASANVEMTNR